jgi:hypothetical protein
MSATAFVYKPPIGSRSPAEKEEWRVSLVKHLSIDLKINIFEGVFSRVKQFSIRKRDGMFFTTPGQLELDRWAKDCRRRSSSLRSCQIKI